LITDMVARLRGDAEDRLDDGPALEGHGWLAVAFLTAGVVSVGLPPTSGFLGKTFILEATIPSPTTAWEWGGLLGSSFLVLLAFALAGSRLFWKTEEETASGQFDAPGRAAAPAVLLALIAGWTVFAGPAYDYIRRTAVQTLDRENYVHAVDPQNFDPSTAGHGGDGH
ncbi:MAG: monovalent cation/H+ antiporter subunit D, partial [Bradymonadaceae bacterium]